MELIRKVQNTQREQLSHMEQSDKLKNTKFNQMNLDEAEEQKADDIIVVSTSQSILPMNR